MCFVAEMVGSFAPNSYRSLVRSTLSAFGPHCDPCRYE
ncbi:hypothetical protein CEV32_3986 [Brucella rhizosphaerae]|uniref:Uncharacterized protein n=1 Tax=Brucella rhizosphaerae TaxID=571254 RepID=A0A256FS38_9HYPH|nr:hypothetical protein CEV32_3986 [Brucella rhizosphaerae]